MKRIDSIDALRGLTILAMILCAAVNWGSGLPAWMFHCQTPPPDFAFHPEVRGLTWVDMVFPVFIFSMGAAIPIALGRKLQKGNSISSVCLGALKRWVVLVLFSLALGAADAANGASAGEWAVGIFRTAVWLAIFAALLRTDRRWVNFAGWAVLAVLVLVEWLVLGVQPSLKNNDCIILLLAHASLMCSLIWLATRKDQRLRVLVTLLVLVAQISGYMHDGKALMFPQYLVIALPATLAGDWLLDGRPHCLPGRRSVAASAAAVAAVLIQLWGLYTRNVALDFAFTMVCAPVFVLLQSRDRSAFSLLGFMGFVMLLAGIVLDPVCGGIAKDYCNASYLLVTGGQAALLLAVLVCAGQMHPLSPVLTMPGQNPMIAYTVAWYVIYPLMAVSGLLPLINGFCSRGPWLGLLQGVAVTAFSAALTSMFTHFKVYLRS